MRQLATGLLACVLALVCQAPWCLAVDYDGNVDFMKVVPKEYKENFPYCDEFLDMEWVESKNSSINWPTQTVWVGKAIVDVYGEKKERKGLVSLIGVRSPREKQKAWQPLQFSYIVPLDEYQRLDWHDPSLKFTIMQVEEDCTREEYPRTLGVWSEKYRGQKNNSGISPHGRFIPQDTEIKLISEQIVGVGGAMSGRLTSRLQREFTRYDVRTLSQYTKNICLVGPSGQDGWELESAHPFYREDIMSDEDRRKFEASSKY